MQFDYADLLSAATGLLCESVAVVSTTTQPFVVVGGWSPLLLNSGKVQHPGTRDVDIVFRDGATEGELADVVRALRSAGYVPSAKHSFQLLRHLFVFGEEFVFNLDLLHATDGTERPEMFADHLSLPVRVSDFSQALVAVGSVKARFTDFLFDRHIVTAQVDGVLPDGTSVRTNVPLMDETGTLVTKAESMRSPKRRRDAFDVVLAIVQARDRGKLVRDLKELRTTHKRAFAELSKLHYLLTVPQLGGNVDASWKTAGYGRNWEAIVQEFLQAAEVPPPKEAQDVRDTRPSG